MARICARRGDPLLRSCLAAHQDDSLGSGSLDFARDDKDTLVPTLRIRMTAWEADPSTSLGMTKTRSWPRRVRMSL
jgi:hypothetical protein